jgi:RNA polymerase sigma factor (sigma-70 family)
MPDHERTDASTAQSAADIGATTRTEFATFYRRTVKELVGFLVLQGAQLVDAADIAQDTLSAAYQRWHTIDHPRAWSYRVASRALIRKLATVEDPADEPPEPSPLLRATNIEYWEQQQDIVHVLALLPPRQRQVMAWTLYGYTPKEIAEELGIEPTAVRANLMKARRALVAHLTGKEGNQ